MKPTRYKKGKIRNETQSDIFILHSNKWTLKHSKLKVLVPLKEWLRTKKGKEMEWI